MSDVMYQERINLPSSSEILTAVLEDEELYAKYVEYSKPLEKYRGLQESLKNAKKRVSRIKREIKELKSQCEQSGENTRMDELYRMRKTEENKVESYRKQMSEMEAGDLYKVIISEAQRLVEEQRKKDYERYKEKSKERTQNIIKRTRIEGIRYNANFLSKAIAENSKYKHIPDVFKLAVGNFINAIDTSSEKYYFGEEPTQEDISIANSIRAMSGVLENADDTELKEYLEFCGITGDVVQEFKVIAGKITDIALTYGNRNDIILQNMNEEELRALSKAIRELEHLISATNKLIEDNGYKNVSAFSEQSARSEIKSEQKAQSEIKTKIPASTVYCIATCVIMGLLYLLGIADLDYGYYTFLRIFSLIALLILIFVYMGVSESINNPITYVAGVTVILFNPIIPIYLDKGTWVVFDLICGVAMIACGIYVLIDHLRSNRSKR